MCWKTKVLCFCCDVFLLTTLMKECKKMKNACTPNVDPKKLCWHWTVKIVQGPYDICEPCLKKFCHVRVLKLKGKRCAARRSVPVRKEYKGRSY